MRRNLKRRKRNIEKRRRKKKRRRKSIRRARIEMQLNQSSSNLQLFSKIQML